MTYMSDKVEFVTYANELQEVRSVWRSTTITLADLYEGFSADHATRYLVTFEMTIKPLPEEPSISASHPHTDGSER
jgi:hypothetical protein